MIKIKSSILSDTYSLMKLCLFTLLFFVAGISVQAQITATVSPTDPIIEYCDIGTGTAQNFVVTASTACGTGSTPLSYQWYTITAGVWTPLLASPPASAPYNSGTAATISVTDMQTLFNNCDSLTCVVKETQTGSGCTDIDTVGNWKLVAISAAPTTTLTPSFFACEGDEVSWTGAVTAPAVTGTLAIYWTRAPHVGASTDDNYEMASGAATVDTTYKYNSVLADDQDTIFFTAGNVCGNAATLSSVLSTLPKPKLVTTTDTTFCPSAMGTATISYEVTNDTLDLSDAVHGGNAVNWTLHGTVSGGDAATATLIQTLWDANNTGTGDDSVSIDVLTAGVLTPGVYTITLDSLEKDAGSPLGSPSCVTIYTTEKITITIQAEPVINFSANKIEMCEGEDSSFMVQIGHAESAVDASWEYWLTDTGNSVANNCSGVSSALSFTTSGTGNDTATFSLSSLEPGIYTYHIDSFKNTLALPNCGAFIKTGMDTITIIVYPKPIAKFSKLNEVICPSDSGSVDIKISNTKYCSTVGDVDTANYRLYYTDGTSSDIGSISNVTHFAGPPTGFASDSLGTFNIVTNSGAFYTMGSHDFSLDSIELTGLTHACKVVLSDSNEYQLSITPEPDVTKLTVTDATICEEKSGEFLQMIIDAGPLDWEIFYTVEGRSVDTMMCGQNMNPGVVSQNPIMGNGKDTLDFSIHTDVPVGVYKYTIDSIKYKNSTCNSTFAPIDTTFQIDPIPMVEFLPEDTSFCEGGTGTFDLAVTNAKQCVSATGPGSVNQNWNLTVVDSITNAVYTSRTGTGNDTTSYPIRTTLLPGSNHFKVTDKTNTSSLDNCVVVETDSFTVLVEPEPVIGFTSNKLEICQGAGGTIDVEVTNAMMDGVPQGWKYFFTETSGKLDSLDCKDSSFARSNIIDTDSLVTGAGNKTGVTLLQYTIPASLEVGIYTFKLDSIITDSMCKGTVVAAMDSFTLIVNPNPVVSIVETGDTICENAKGSFELRVTNARRCADFNTPVDVNWTLTYDDNVDSDIAAKLAGAMNGNDTFTIIANNTGALVMDFDTTRHDTFSISSIATTGLGTNCTVATVDSFFLRLYPEPTLEVTTATNITLCEGQVDTIDLEILNAEIGNMGTIDESFDWKIYISDSSGNVITHCDTAELKSLIPGFASGVISGSGNDSNSTRQRIAIPSNLPAGIYNIYLDSIRNETSPLTCKGTIIGSNKITINVRPMPVATYIPLADTVCPGSSITVELAVTNAQYCADFDSVLVDDAWRVYYSNDEVTGRSVADTFGTGNDTLAYVTSPSLITGIYDFELDSVRNNVCAAFKTPVSVDSLYKLYVAPNPMAKFGSSDMTICEGDKDSASIVVSNAVFGTNDIAWTAYVTERSGNMSSGCVDNVISSAIPVTVPGTGDSTVKFDLSSLTTGIYTFKLDSIRNTDGEMCIGMTNMPDSITITVNPVPVASIAPDTLTICANDNMSTFDIDIANTQYCPTISAGGVAGTYADRTLWFTDNAHTPISTPHLGTGNIINAIANSDSTLTAGYYAFSIDSISIDLGCSQKLSDTIIVEVIGTPELEIVSFQDTSCIGQGMPVVYNVTGVSASQEWEFTYAFHNPTTNVDTIRGTGPVTGGTFIVDTFSVIGADTVSFTSIVTTNGFACGSSIIHDSLPFFIFDNPDVSVLSFTSTDTVCSGSPASLQMTTTTTGGRDWTIFYRVGTTSGTYSNTGDGTFTAVTANLLSTKVGSENDTMIVTIDSIKWDDAPMCISKPVTAIDTTVIIKPAPSIDITSDSAICEGSVLTVDYVISGVPSGDLWTFTHRTTNPADGPNPVMGGPLTGTFNTTTLTPYGLTDVEINSLTNTTSGCMALALDTIEDVVILPNNPVADWSPASSSQTFCYSTTDTWTDSFEVKNTFGQAWTAYFNEGDSTGLMLTGTGDGVYAYTTQVGRMVEDFDVVITKINTTYAGITCEKVLANTSTLTVNIIPEAGATINGVPSTICQNETVGFSIDVSGIPTSDSWTAYYTLDGVSSTKSAAGSGSFSIVSAAVASTGTVNLSIDSIVNTTQMTSAGSSCMKVLMGIDTTIMVDPTSNGGTISGSNTVCVTSNGGTVSVAGVVGAITKWQSSVDGGATWSDIISTSNSINYSNLTMTTMYRVVAQSGTCSSDYSDTATITVATAATVAIANAKPTTICSGDDVILSFNVANTGGGAWTTYYSVNGTPGTMTGTGDGVAVMNTTLSSLTVNSTVQLDSISVTGGCSNPALTDNFEIIVNPLPTVSVSASSGTLCAGSTGTINVVVDGVAAGQSWSVTYDEGTSTGLSRTGTGSGSFTITTGSLTSTTDVKLTGVVNTTTSCVGSIDTTVTIEVDPATEGGTTGVNASVCIGNNSGVVELDDETGAVVKWQSSINGGSTWTDIVTTDTFVNYSNLTVETMYRAVVQSGVCAVVNSLATTISIKPMPVVTIANAKPTTICSGDDVTLSFNVSNTDGTAWTVNYTANGTAGTMTGTGDGTGVMNTTLDSVTVNTTVQLVSITTGSCDNPSLTDNFEIIVNPLPTVSVSASSGTLCAGSTGTVNVVVDGVAAGQSWSVTYDEGTSTGLSRTGTGSGSFTITTGSLTSTTDVKLTGVVNTTTSCVGSIDTTVTIEVDPATVGGTTGVNASVCIGNNSGVVELDGETGAVVKWQSSINGGSTWTDIVTTDTFVNYSNLTVETMYRAVVQSGVCAVVNSSATTISIKPMPVVTIANAKPTTICSGDDVTLSFNVSNTDGTAWTVNYTANGTAGTMTGTGDGTGVMNTTLDSVTVNTTVQLVSITTGSCDNPSLTDNLVITVNPLPTVSVSASTDSLCQGGTGTISIVVDGVASGESWSVTYDEGTSTGLSRTGTGSGSFTITTGSLTSTTDVKLTGVVNTTTTCVGDVDTTISIHVSPTTVGGSITPTNSFGCYGVNSGTITLSGHTGDVQNWEYSTDGGNTWTVASNNSTSLTYSNLLVTTMYRALVKSGPCSNAYSGTATVTVYPQPEAVISGSPKVCPNEAAVFSVNVSNVPAGNAWSLEYIENGSARVLTGIGSGSFDLTTLGYNYTTTPSTINVSLSAITNVLTTCRNSALSSAASAQITPEPNADFTADNSCQDSDVTFVNLSTIPEGSVAGYKWYFGDGDSSLSTNPMHTYASAGTYTVRLVAISENGCAGEVTKSVTVYDAPKADFTFTNVCKNADFSPMDASTIASGTITNWSWNFGDNSAASTDRNPTHNYAASGNYTVTLTVTSNNGCTNTITKDVTIYVLPDADFTSDEVCEDAVMSFVNGSSIPYGSMTYSWDFAGQGSSNEVSPDFMFTGNGKFNVKLVSISDNGCRDSITQEVTVWPKPSAAFTVADVCLDEVSNFVNTSTIDAPGAIVNNFWTFGDATYSTGDNPTHTYAIANASGFDVELRAVSDKGCADTVSGSAVVWPLPVVTVTADRPAFCEGDETKIIASSDQANSTYSWSSGETSEEIIAKTEGWYVVTVTGDQTMGGCSAKDSTFITVWDGPIVDAGPDTIINKGSSIDLMGQGSGGSGSLNFAWTPVDMVVSSVDPTTSTTDLVETTIFTLSVTDGNGCTASDDVEISVEDKFVLRPYNVVTPNGDGSNDVWYIDNIVAYPNAEVAIFNRYGMEVFKTQGYDNSVNSDKSWDGTYNGKDLPDGAYYYVITLQGQDNSYSGNINLIRGTK